MYVSICACTRVTCRCLRTYVFWSACRCTCVKLCLCLYRLGAFSREGLFTCMHCWCWKEREGITHHRLVRKREISLKPKQVILRVHIPTHEHLHAYLTHERTHNTHAAKATLSPLYLSLSLLPPPHPLSLSHTCAHT